MEQKLNNQEAVETTPAEETTTSEQEVETVKDEKTETQDTQPEQTKNEEKKEVIKSLTQEEIDSIIERRLSRQKEALTKEAEALLNAKEKEYQAKLETMEADTKKLAEEIKNKDSELTRVRYGIKEDLYDEVLALRDFRMKKDPNASEDEVLKSILEEHPDYVESSVKHIGIEITSDEVKAENLYSDNLIRMYPWLGKIK